MSTNAIIYINPALPIEVQNVDRLVYLPDGSQHLLDKHDRPLFIAPANAGVVIFMQYALDEEPKEEQVAPFAREQHRKKLEMVKREEAAAELTQQFPKITEEDMVNVSPHTGVATSVMPIHPVPLQQRAPFPNPRVAEFGPRSVQWPGAVTVRTSAEVPDDVTGEVVMPDFQEAPKGATQELAESSSPQSPEFGETEQTSEPGRAAS